jgi:hypothetical protein
MDRNLGAITDDITSTGSYGYYYQFWNNWGTSQATASQKILKWSTSDSTVDLTEYSPSNPYYVTNFIYWRNTSHGSNELDWAVVSNDNIWWWNGTEYERQWPCPAWYHIPTNQEWQDVIDYWLAATWEQSLNNNNIDALIVYCYMCYNYSTRRIERSW